MSKPLDANQIARERGIDELRRVLDDAPHSGALVDQYEVKWHGDVHLAPLKEWLVDKTLPKVGKALVAGQWGTFKTFVTLDLARAVMTMTTFAGRTVKRQGGVLFIAAEGQDEVRVRLEGIARGIVVPEGALRIDPAKMPFAWIESCPMLTADHASEKLSEIVRAAAVGMQERFNLPLALIVIDTLMPAAGFKDANDASETQRVMSVLTTVAMEAKALILAVDHFGKDITTGTRNSSVKEDAVDAVLALLADRDISGNVSNPRLAVRKVRGAPTGQEIPFKTRVVTVHENAGHDALTTLVIDWESAEPKSHDQSPKRKQRPLPKSLAIFKKAVDFVIADSGETMRPFHDGAEVRAVKRDAVRHEFRKTYPADNLRARDKAFERCEQAAIAGGIINSREIGEQGVAETFYWVI